MNLYLISQDVNSDYDTYYNAVVAARSIADAKSIHPNGSDETPKKSIIGHRGYPIDQEYSGTWTGRDNVKATKIGIAAPKTKRGVIVASFNAG